MRVFTSLTVLIVGAVVQHANAQADYGYVLIHTPICSQSLMMYIERTMATTVAAALVVILAATQAALPAVVLTMIPTVSPMEIQVDFQMVLPQD